MAENKSVNIEIEGDEEFLAKLERLGAQVPLVSAAALYRAAEAIATKSKQNYVPIDTGALRSTIHVKPPEIGQDEITVIIGAGGPAAPYAVYVHEINKNYRNGKQWKYLETPLKESVGEVAGEIRFSIEDAVRNL